MKSIALKFNMINIKTILLVLLFITLSACAHHEKEIRRRTLSMGTFFEIKAIVADRQKAEETFDKAFAEINRLDKKYSTYRNNNLMFEINNSDKRDFRLDDETYFLLKKCDGFHRITHGGFDPAIGNLIDMLGFEKNKPHLPERQEVREALKSTGWKQITLYGKNRMKMNKKVKLNFGAVVKGYAVDRAAAVLLKNGIEIFLINGGGEIFARGKNWKIGIQHPREENKLLGAIVLNGKAIATSGDYRQFIKIKNKRISHIINPITGQPASGCESVSVIANDVMTADAIATGLFVLGPQTGLEVLKTNRNLEGLIIDSTGSLLMSDGFKNIFSPAK